MSERIQGRDVIGRLLRIGALCAVGLIVGCAAEAPATRDSVPPPRQQNAAPAEPEPAQPAPDLSKDQAAADLDAALRRIEQTTRQSAEPPTGGVPGGAEEQRLVAGGARLVPSDALSILFGHGALTEFKAADGSAATATYYADGTVKLHSTKGAAGAEVEGRWRIRKDFRCVTWLTGGVRQESCYRDYRLQRNQYRAYAENGKFNGAYSFKY